MVAAAVSFQARTGFHRSWGWECGQAWHHAAVGFLGVEPVLRSTLPTQWWPSVWRTANGNEQSGTFFPGPGASWGDILWHPEKRPMREGSCSPLSPACRVTVTCHRESLVLDRLTHSQRKLAQDIFMVPFVDCLCHSPQAPDLLSDVWKRLHFGKDQ